MAKGYRETNPFFLPALITTLFPVVNLFLVRISGNGSLQDLLIVLELIVPPVALILSVSSLVNAKKHGEGIGNVTVCFAVCSIIVLLFSSCSFAGLCLSGSLHRCMPAEPTRSLSPEDEERIASVREEIYRALNGETIRRSENEK